MKLRSALYVGVALVGLLANPVATFAQDAGASGATTPTPAPAAAAPAAPAAPANGAGAATDQTAAPDAQKRDPEKNWLKVCDKIKDGKQACIMRQVVLQNGQFLGSFLLRDDPGQESRLLAVAAVPLGVLLPFGLTWQIDSGKPIRVPYMLCDPESCATQLVINEAYVNSLKKGATLKLTAKTRQNKDLVININLAGFTAVYDGNKALSFEQFRKRESGQNALEKVLQDKAEQIRQEKSDGTSTGSGAATGTDSTTAAPAAGN